MGEEAGHKPEESKCLFPISTLFKDFLQGRQGDFMCKIDLKDAYLSVLMNKSHRKYLPFMWMATYTSFYPQLLWILQNCQKYQLHYPVN